MDCVEMFGSTTNGFTGKSYRIPTRGNSKSSGRMGPRRKQIRQQFDNYLLTKSVRERQEQKKDKSESDRP
jgi:hypothetical protein